MTNPRPGLHEQRCEVKTPDPDIMAMARAYDELKSIPVEGNRRYAAIWWLNERVLAEIKHELDRSAIKAVAAVSEIEARRAVPAPPPPPPNIQRSTTPI